MVKEKTQYEKHRQETLDNPQFNPTIEGDEKNIEMILEEDNEFLNLLIEEIKNRKATVRVTGSKKTNKWKLEIFQTDNNKPVYVTDIPIDVLMIEKRIISAGLIPEYIEE